MKPVLKMKVLLPLVLVSLFPVAGWAAEQDEPAEAAAESVLTLSDDMVVAERGGAAVTVGQLRAKVRTALPAGKRRGYFSDGERVGGLVDSLLATRQIAAVAKANGLDRDPELLAEIEEYTLDLLARRQLAQHLDSLEEPDAETLARERYQVNKDDYRVPATKDVRHILIAVEDRTEGEALERAEEVRSLLLSGSDFDEVRKEYSDDPDVRHKGWVRGVGFENYEQAFTETVLGLSEIGDISEPVRTPYGYHVIRLEKDNPERIRPFDEVKDELVSKILTEFRTAARSAYMDSFISEPMKLHDEVIKFLPSVEP